MNIKEMKRGGKNLGLIMFFISLSLIFFISSASAGFNASSNQSDINWEVFATTPINLTNTKGCFWVNWTWEAGAGRIPPSSWNVSINGTDHNGTTNTFYNQSTVPGHTWINISLWGYNSTDDVLSEISLDGQQQAANNHITITNTSNWQGDEEELVYLDFNYADLDGDIATFSTNATKGSFNTATGVFEWQTDMASQGIYFWNFTVSDGWGSEDFYVASITVNDKGVYEDTSFDLAETNIKMMILGITLIPIISILSILLLVIYKQEEVDWRILLGLFVSIGIASALLLVFFVMVFLIQTA